MTTVKLHDDVYTNLFIIKKSEFDKMQYVYVSISDRNIKTAFLPKHGTTLFFENKHFIIISDKEPRKKYAVWRNHKVIGYCEITEKAAEKANGASNACFYFGVDRTIAPEIYGGR